MTEATTSDALSSVIAPVLVPLGCASTTWSWPVRPTAPARSASWSSGPTLRLSTSTSHGPCTEALSPVLDTDPSADRILRGRTPSRSAVPASSGRSGAPTATASSVTSSP